MISVGVIGAGHWGPNLIRNFHNKQTSEVLWIADRDHGRVEQVRKRFPDVQVTDDASRVIADERVQAVVVATPTSTHYALVKAALERGKHVLVEKPITADVKQGEELCALAEAKGRVLLVGHVFVYNEAVRRAKRYIQERELGNLFYISMVRTNLGPIRADVNAAWDLAAHDISIVDYWLDGHALAASASGGIWINAGIEDAVFATLRYPDNVLVHLHVSWLDPRKAREITVVGDKRMLTLDDMNMIEPLRIYDKGVSEKPSAPGYADTFSSFRAAIREGDIVSPRVALGEPLKAECDHFLDCIAHEKRPMTGGREAVAVVRTLEAIQRSLKNLGREQTA